MNKTERKRVVRAMELIARQVNDEEVFNIWLCNGVADGDIDYDEDDLTQVDDYYCEDEHFADLMETFLDLMKAAKKSGGLYCDDVVSKHEGDKMNIVAVYFTTLKNDKLTHISNNFSSLEEAVKFALKHSINTDRVLISKVWYDKDAAEPTCQREIIFDIDLKEDDE